MLLCEKLTIVQTELPKLCIRQLPIIHVLYENMMMHKTQNAPSHYLSCNIYLYLIRYTNPHPSTSCMRQHDP